MFHRLKETIVRALRCLIIAAALLLGQAPAHADSTGVMEIVNAGFGDGASVSGSFTYSFSGTSLTAIDAIDLTFSAAPTFNGYVAMPALNFLYNVPGQADTIADLRFEQLPGTRYYAFGAQYVAEIGSQSPGFSLVFSDLGAEAVVVAGAPGVQNFVSSYGALMTNVGFSVDPLVPTIPEPGAALLLLSGVVGFGMMRARRRG